MKLRRISAGLLRSVLLASLALLPFFVTVFACKDKSGPLDRAKSAIDDAAEEIQSAAEDALDDARDETERLIAEKKKELNKLTKQLKQQADSPELKRSVERAKRELADLEAKLQRLAKD